MITFIAHVRVAPENAAAFEALIGGVRDMTHENEPGVVFYEWSRSVDEADTYVVIEVYGDAQVHAAHMASPWVRDSLPNALKLMKQPPDIRQYVTPGTEPIPMRTGRSSGA